MIAARLSLALVVFTPACRSDEAIVAEGDTGSSTSSSSDATTSGELSTSTTSSGDTSGSESSTAAEPACPAAWVRKPVVAAHAWMAADPVLGRVQGLGGAPGGGFFLAHAAVEDGTDDYDVIAAAYGSGGELLWVDRYTGSGLADWNFGAEMDRGGRPYMLVQENLAEVWGDGWTFIDARMVLLAYDEAGGHRWRWEYHPQPTDPEWPHNEYHAALSIDADGDLHVLVLRDVWNGDGPLVLFEIDGAGNVLAESTAIGVSSSFNYDFGVAHDGARRILFESGQHPQTGGTVHGVDDAGQLFALASFAGREFAHPRLAVAADGGFVAVGYSRHDDGHFGYLRGFTADGHPAISITRSPLPIHPTAAAIDCDGTILVTAGDLDRALVIAFAPDGEELWEVSARPEGGEIHAGHIAIASDASAVVVAGARDDDLGTHPWFVALTPG